MLILLTAGAAVAAEVAGEKRVALVIGNAQYHTGGPATGMAANASAMADALRRAGFTVTVGNNLDHRSMVAALSRFQDSLADADLGFLYYSGLALSLSAKGFLVPVDAKLASEYDVIFDTIELDYALKELQSAGRKAVAVFDPVPGHPLADKLTVAMGDAGRSVKPVLATPSALDNLFVAYAHRPGVPPAPLSGNGPSPFTAALAQEMVKPGVPLRDALAEVARVVVGKTKGAQHPWLQDRLGGDLVLVPATGVAALPPPKPDAAKPETPKPEEKPAVLEVEVEPLDEKRVTTRDTNLRTSPDVKSSVLTVLRHDTEVKVTGRPRKGSGWLRVEHDGKTGFASAANLARPEEAGGRNAPVASAAPATPEAATGIYAVARPSTMFARPMLGARSVRDLEQGQMITVVEAVPDSNWVKVRDRFGQEGYVTAAALSRWSDAVAERAPPASPSPVVTRGDVDPLAGALSGASGPTEMAALPAAPRGGSAPPGDPVVKGLASPFREAVDSGRSAAARAAAGPNSAAGLARTAGERARQAQASARQAADLARSGQSTGHRAHRFPNGDVYEGAWARGFENPLQPSLSKQGFGVYRFANGQVYEGEWKGDVMAGYGVMTFTTGDRYEGTFSANTPNGPGIYRFTNGDVYAGEVRQGRVEGYGEMAFSNGDRYQGMIVDRLPSGNGELILRGGARHVGQFRGGIQDGPGASVDGGGAMRPGYWRGATLLGE
ncbi:caspase family protein [Azospirillum soli]|uniref:caspase family protein n=1 Tax=Azospirillum soli TaxID=1304799 RepID=UPI001AE90BCD|nr:caspase family protein [Azospirillum soli]MBP2311120.1 hypothetical protein [Azospirillum soli]